MINKIAKGILQSISMFGIALALTADKPSLSGALLFMLLNTFTYFMGDDYEKSKR